MGSAMDCPTVIGPVIPFGTGTSLEGHLNAPNGGISVDLSRMNRVVAVHADDLVDLMLGKLNPQKAFFSGKLKIQGDMTLAMKLQSIIG